jgi:hypothetical protein
VLFPNPCSLLRERCALLGELWSADIRAETLHKAAPSLKESYEYAGLRGARWLVLLEDSSLSMADSVRLKHLAAFGRLAGKEEVVARGEVTRYLAALACPAPGGATGGAGGGGRGGGGVGPSKVRRSSVDKIFYDRSTKWQSSRCLCAILQSCPGRGLPFSSARLRSHQMPA